MSLFDNNPYQPPRTPFNSSEPNVQGRKKQKTPASRGHRLLASILDTFVNVLVLLPIMNYMGILNEGVVNFSSQVTAFLLGFLAIIVLHGYLLHSRGQSIGKAIVGIQIVGVDGTQVSLSTIIFRRYLPVQLSGMIPGFGPVLTILDAVWIFRDDGRCIHDHIAGTMVVNFTPQQ